ncbi:T9SS type A sorting domain-containing protein [Lacinutrix salivirga]
MTQKLLFFITLILSFSAFAQDDASFTLSPTCDGAIVLTVATPGGTYMFNPEPTDGAIINTNTGTVINGTSNVSYTIEYTTNGSQPATSSETFTVLNSPVAGAPISNEVCDDNNDDFAIFDLTTNDAYFSGGSSNFIVSYFVSQADANSNSSPIINSNTYTNITNPQTLFVRVEDATTNCFVTSTLTISVLPLPTPSQNIPVLEVCDDDNDGFSTFDLTINELYIANGEPYSFSYFESLAEAEGNFNQISNPTNYFNTANPQTIFVRVEISNSGCFTIVDFDIVVNPIPLHSVITDFIICELNTDGFANFDLNTKTNEVLNSQDPTIHSVSYYETQADANNGTNSIFSPYFNVSNPQTIYVKITNNNTGCSSTVSTFDLVVAETPQANSVFYELCDDNVETDNDPTNNSSQFDLSTQNAIILNGQDPSVFNINYFETQADADFNVNPLPLLYSNTTNPQVVFARVDNSQCYEVTTLTLNVNALPASMLQNEVEYCAGETTVLNTALNTSSYAFEWAYNGVVLIDETNETLTVNQAGVYDVVIFDLNTGCSLSNTVSVTEVNCVDSDGDGVDDSDEDVNGNGNLDDDDTDMDTIPNYLDEDDDGDNVPTSIEVEAAFGRTTLHIFIDTDNDLIENYLDDDDDGDGVLTINEDYNNNGDPTDDDTDFSGAPDYLEANVALSINEFSSYNFKFYPNPANNQITIQLNTNLNEECLVEIINLQGKKIIEKNIKSETSNINLNVSNLQSGLYFVKLKLKNKQAIKKLIIE